MNILREFYLENAKRLISELRRADKVDHGPTKGDMRETAIKETLNTVLPYSFEVKSGHVCDAKGNRSPQIDALIYQKGELAPVLLVQDSFVLPYELFRVGLEIKSTLSTKHFKQIKEQVESLSNMFFSAFLPATNGRVNHTTVSFQRNKPFYFYIVAAETDVSTERLKKELMSINGLTGIFVINKGLIHRDSDIDYVEITDEERIITFWGLINHLCQETSEQINFSTFDIVQIKFQLQKIRPDLLLNRVLFQSALNKIQRPSLFPYLYPEKTEEKE